MCFASLVLSACAQHADFANCAQRTDSELRYNACSAVIAAGGLTDERLARIYNNRGIANERLGRNEAAIADYDIALELFPTYAVALTNRGYANKKLGRLEQALVDLDASLALDGNDWLSYSHRGDIHARLGNTDFAVRDFEKAIAYAPAGSSLLNRTAYKFLLIDMPQRALASVNAALRRQPDNAAYWDTLGDVYCRIGDFDRAGVAFLTAFELDNGIALAKRKQLAKNGYPEVLAGDFSAEEIIGAMALWFADGCPGVVVDNSVWPLT